MVMTPLVNLLFDFIFVHLPISGYLTMVRRQKRLTDEEVTALEKAGSDLHRCAFSGCSNREVVAVLCHFCKRNFCFPHRHPPDHLCLQMPKPRTEDYMPKTTAVVRDIIRGETLEDPKPHCLPA